MFELPDDSRPIPASRNYGDSGSFASERSSNNNAVNTGVDNLDHNDFNQLQRHLISRQIQLIAIGGAIGTAIFVNIGTGLQQGGPGSILFAFVIQAIMVGLISNGLAEMSVYLPISGGFVRFAGRWVDDAWGFMAGWNFFLYEAFLVPFEIAALNLVLRYWGQNIPIPAVVIACTILYGVLNVVTVRFFGEAEFWLAGGKVILIIIVFSFAFVTMVGGNPQGDPYGFRYWNNPGSFAEHIEEGDLGRFHGFMGALSSAVFTVVGPEYISMVAGEAKHPRRHLKTAFKTVYWRFGLFFVGSALCVGIVIPYSQAELDNSDTGTADGSPYIIAMHLMGISVLPHIVNALLCTSIISAGNAYFYCSMRCLYGLALEGHAPAFLKRCTSNGIPIYCFAVVICFPFLAFFQGLTRPIASSGTADVVIRLQALTSASGLINYIAMGVTYIFFFRACRAQGLDRDTLHYRGYFQPYGTYLSVGWMVLMVFTFGYPVFLDAVSWDTLTFFSSYAMVMFSVVAFFGWKLFKKTRFIRPHEADLIWEKPIIDAYERENCADPSSRSWDDLKTRFGFGQKHRSKEGVREV